MPTLEQIVSKIEEFAPLSLQESWDNSGWQLLTIPSDTRCSGVLVCVDVTPERVAEARGLGCNLIVSHHPLIFKGLRSITGRTLQERAVVDAIRSGVMVYSSHTALDSAEGGVSRVLAERLGLEGVRPLVPSGDGLTGLGAVGLLPGDGLGRGEFVELVKGVYGQPSVRVTRGRGEGGEGGDGGEGRIRCVALCGGSGGEFIGRALGVGADAYVTSDVRYHDFVDFGGELVVVDTGHYESENCTKSIISGIISENFANFAVYMSARECAPVEYM